MRRVGTISAAAGLIYLGIWMIIGKANPGLGAEVFKWWPVIFIILGIEVLVQFARKGEGRIGFNFLIVPVLIFMLIINMFNGVKLGFGSWLNNWHGWNGNSISIGGLKFGNNKPINTSKTLPAYGKVIYIHTNNASIHVNKSNSGDIKLDGRVYVDDDSFASKYDITEKKDENGYSIDILDNFIKGVKFDLYIPEGYNVKLLVDNLDMDSSDDLDNSNFNIEADNASVKLNKAQSMVMNFGNGSVNLDDVKDINLNGNNGNINVKGKSENINIKTGNGKINIDNEVCKNVNIDLNQGVASVRTDDEDVDVKIELQQGVSGINNDKNINSGISKVFGQGTGKVEIKVNQGTANFRN